MTRALVTGGAGFIGSHIAQLLIERGIETVVLDDLSMGRQENVPVGAQFILGDIREQDTLDYCLQGVDVVFHEAAKVSIRHSIANFVEDAQINIQGTINLLAASARAGVKKLITASSMAVYGDVEHLPINEAHPCRPTTPYGISKLAAEQYVLTMGRHLGMTAIALRYFNTYGPRQTFTPYVGVITIFIRQLLAGNRPLIFGSGEQVRDFVSVFDIARANVLAMERGTPGSVFNIGSGCGTTVNDLYRMVQRAVGADVPPEYGPQQLGEPRDSIADLRAARAALGYQPVGSLEQELPHIVAWNRAEQAPPEAHKHHCEE